MKCLLPAYTSITPNETGLSVWKFAEDINAGNVDGFMERMKSIIAGIPYDDFAKKDIRLREQNYQAAMYLIFALMSQFVQTEVHCATGRADCIVETKTAVYIFEFKLTDNGTPEDALAQIKEKNYAGKCKSSGKKIVAVGTSFDEELRTIKEFLVEEII